MTVTTEYIFHNPLREEICDFEHREKGNIQLFDKLENKMENAWVEGRCLLYQAKTREVAYKGRFKSHKIKKINITKERSIEKHIINTYLNMNITMMWRKFFENIASNRDSEYI